MRILVTGAAGLIGGELAGLLAERGHSVVALVHRSKALSRGDGRPLAAAPWTGAPPRQGEVVTLAGDVRRPALGLDAVQRGALLGGLDLVAHCAAATGFGLDPRVHHGVNVAGTANVVALAERGGPRLVPLLHVSTAYVCGEHSGPVSEDELDVDQVFTNGYEASKAAAERLVGAAGERGLVVAVARPSIVVGAFADGAIGRFDGLYAIIRLVAEGRVRTIPASPGASLDLVPVDYVAESLADIAERMAAAAGRTFHLVSGTPFPMATLAELALDYPKFHAPRFVAPEAFDPAHLPASERRLYEQLTGFYASYFRRDPRFRDENLRALCGRACPALGRPFLHRMIDHCIAAGFLGRGGAAAHRTSG